ncbi:MAG TPA: peptide chain release factor N(5)-glutamine methyltransferase [Candidatus Fimimorpha faecalis]|uniref:Release factor glutamine methyltransferase n=1 Tax=Candidatus Fimimorpha faecalis TaxID=2840824 RepID=A0A9D1JE03_9FIRM|nr:peptide chain release factor N(5)-glutamine methyltransferase [Candidatus Fimimorpha faecalis]
MIEITTYAKLLEEGKKTLETAGILEAELDAWYLLSDTISIDRTKFLVDRNDPKELDHDLLEQYRSRLKKRAMRIPLQHILGIQEFMGIEFLVNGKVLIPRQDTEVLVEEVLKEKGGTVLDLCTGSGCIAVSLAKLGHFQQVDAADISVDALDIAKENAKRAGVQVRFYQGNLFETITQKYDIIVSNPPYIPKEVIETLEPEVKKYEPYQALYGPNHGLYFYETISKFAVDFLNSDGKIFYEIGYDQAEAVCTILERNKYKEIEVIADLSGKNRVVKARK